MQVDKVTVTKSNKKTKTQSFNELITEIAVKSKDNLKYFFFLSFLFFVFSFNSQKNRCTEKCNENLSTFANPLVNSTLGWMDLRTNQPIENNFQLYKFAFVLRDPTFGIAATILLLQSLLAMFQDVKIAFCDVSQHNFSKLIVNNEFSSTLIDALQHIFFCHRYIFNSFNSFSYCI